MALGGQRTEVSEPGEWKENSNNSSYGALILGDGPLEGREGQSLYFCV